MTVAGGQIESAAVAGSAASDQAARDWAAVRHTADIQFTPLPPSKGPLVPHAPEWLKALGRLLEAIFGPVGRFLGMSWPVFQWVLIGLAILLAVFLLWRLLGPVLAQWLRRREKDQEAVQWTPTRAEAAALLEDADRLANEGRFGEAVHLLLQRSVRQISDAQPDWLLPASTAREIAVLPLLPEAGRKAFATIAGRVERSVFALRDLDAQDWTTAREAYADFARIALAA
ncbi:MAG: hypothetical protein P8Y58_13180 [Novosphingobium sp.]